MPGETLVGENEDKSPLGQGWRKASYSMSNGHCLEVARLAGGLRIGVRDSKAVSTEGLVLRFEPRVWTSFLAEIPNFSPFEI
jgi:Domain of unknown function (DUF397)